MMILECVAIEKLIISSQHDIFYVNDIVGKATYVLPPISITPCHIWAKVWMYQLISVMLFKVTFNNISVISWRSFLLVEETGIHRENHTSAASRWQTLSHNVVSSTPHLSGIRTHKVSGDKHW